MCYFRRVLRWRCNLSVGEGRKRKSVLQAYNIRFVLRWFILYKPILSLSCTTLQTKSPKGKPLPIRYPSEIRMHDVHTAVAYRVIFRFSTLDISRQTVFIYDAYADFVWKLLKCVSVRLNRWFPAQSGSVLYFSKNLSYFSSIDITKCRSGTIGERGDKYWCVKF